MIELILDDCMNIMKKYFRDAKIRLNKFKLESITNH